MKEKQARNILVVDDDADILNYLSEVLRKAKFRVLSTTRGEEAVRLATQEKPDLIILDVILPDVLGGVVAKRLSENPATARIPIIFLSGLNTKEDEDIAREKAGNYYLLGKPVTNEELLAVVQRALSG